MTDRMLVERQGLMTRKPVSDIIAEGGAQSLGRSLGVWSITALGIGCIIGAGIFVLTGTAAARYAGPAIVLSFVVGGIACAFVGLCYAELAAILPVAGSTYTYTYATLGEIFAWIIGWDLILEYAMGASTVAVGWSGYIVSLLHNFGIFIPPQWAPRPDRGEAPRWDGRPGGCQPSSRAHCSFPDRDADRRHEGIGTRQQHHGRVQAVRWSSSSSCLAHSMCTLQIGGHSFLIIQENSVTLD